VARQKVEDQPDPSLWEPSGLNENGPAEAGPLIVSNLDR